jgi:hypothetical protein
VAVAWHSGSTDLRAVDLMQFYANFCLAFSDASVEKQMEVVRQARAPKVKTPRGVVTDAKVEEHLVDPNADVIDRITGKAPASQP